jgi:uncharacterized Zn-binding protein involved in type VI secretion
MVGLPVVRVGDFNNKFGVVFVGNPTVLVNARPIATKGPTGMVTKHPGFGKTPHPINPIIKGSLTVLAGPMPVAHKTSPDACLHIMITGSTDVLTGI